MKRFVYIFLLTCPLWVCTSCWIRENDEEKITGTKPEILIGKWELYGSGSFFFDSWKFYQSFEFKKDGGFFVQRSFDYATQTYSEPDTTYRFSNWLYSEKKGVIYYNINESRTRYDRVQSLNGITMDSITIAGKTYYKIKE